MLVPTLVLAALAQDPAMRLPVAVRYAWKANPLNGLLYSDAGYPLAPFTARVGE